MITVTVITIISIEIITMMIIQAPHDLSAAGKDWPHYVQRIDKS